MNAAELARVLGGEAHGNNVQAPGPGHSKADRSLSIRVDAHAPDGFIVHSFAGDDPIDCRDHVRAAIGLPAFDGRREPSSSKPRPTPAAPMVNDTKALAVAIWRQSVDAAGTVVEKYLRSRGLSPEHVADIRYHGALHFDGETVAGMVALRRDIRTNEPVGIHRTFLDREGRKIDRRALGRSETLCCVKLVDDAEVATGLGIAEGIETALAIMEGGWRPVWACLSASNLSKFPVLEGVEALTVFADVDDNQAGQRAANAVACRWAGAGREARIFEAPGGGDANDWLLREVPNG